MFCLIKNCIWKIENEKHVVIYVIIWIIYKTKHSLSVLIMHLCRIGLVVRSVLLFTSVRNSIAKNMWKIGWSDSRKSKKLHTSIQDIKKIIEDSSFLLFRRSVRKKKKPKLEASSCEKSSRIARKAQKRRGLVTEMDNMMASLRIRVDFFLDGKIIN